MDGRTRARRSLARCAGQTRLSFATPLRQAIQTGVRRDAGRVRRKLASGRSAPPIERAHANNRERCEFCRISKRRCFPARVSASVRRKAQQLPEPIRCANEIAVTQNEVKVMSLAIIVAVLLRNALTRQAPVLGKGNGNCRRTKEAFLKQNCGAAAASK